MGTNYYAILDKFPTGQIEHIHLGLLSSGWRFSVEVHKEHYTNYESFRKFLSNKRITILNEYDVVISLQFLIDMIERHKDGRKHVGDGVLVDGFVDLCFYSFT